MWNRLLRCVSHNVAHRRNTQITQLTQKTKIKFIYCRFVQFARHIGGVMVMEGVRWCSSNICRARPKKTFFALMSDVLLYRPAQITYTALVFGVHKHLIPLNWGPNKQILHLLVYAVPLFCSNLQIFRVDQMTKAASNMADSDCTKKNSSSRTPKADDLSPRCSAALAATNCSRSTPHFVR